MSPILQSVYRTYLHNFLQFQSYYVIWLYLSTFRLWSSKSFQEVYFLFVMRIRTRFLMTFCPWSKLDCLYSGQQPHGQCLCFKKLILTTELLIATAGLVIVTAFVITFLNWKMSIWNLFPGIPILAQVKYMKIIKVEWLPWNWPSTTWSHLQRSQHHILY